MDVLPSRVNRSDETFIERIAHNKGLVLTLKDELQKVEKGGGEKYVERHRNRGKALARERIQSSRRKNETHRIGQTSRYFHKHP